MTRAGEHPGHAVSRLEPAKLVALGIALLVAGLLLLLVVWLRLARGGNWGEQMALYPDPVEYAAGAYSIAEEGRFVLHLGPLDARPMYSPGFSMLLAPAVRLGVPGDQLWRVSALLGWPASIAVAAVVAGFAWRRRPRMSIANLLLVGGVALTAGAAWIIAPFSSNFGSTLLSDEATLLASLFTVAALMLGLDGAGRRSALFCALGGAGWVGVAALRPVSAALLAMGGLPILVWLARRGVTAARRTLPWMLLGAAIAVLPVVALLGRSGYPVWRWTAYSFWNPAEKHPGISDFRLEYAWQGNPDRPRGPGQPLVPHGEVAAKTLLGIPGLVPWHYLGYGWPVLGWVSLAIWGLRRARVASLEAALARSIGLWILVTTVLFVVYAWPLVRYLIGPQWVLVVATFAPLAVAAGGARPRRAMLALLAASGITVSSWLLYSRAHATAVPWEDLNGPTRRAVAEWLTQSDAGRQGQKMSFDPARAQALGLLSREVRASIRCWGLPIDRYHWVRLRENGLVRLDGDRRALLADAARRFVRRVDECSAPLSDAATIAAP